MLELPDWNHWGRLKTVALRDALVLSIGLCPNKYNHENTNRTELFYAQKYWDNLQIAKNHVYENDWVIGKVAKKDFDVDVANTSVELDKFCKWALQEVQLSGLPTEMEILGGADFSDSCANNKILGLPAKSNHSKKSQLNGLRRDILTSIFDSAWAHVGYSANWQQTWVRLCELADESQPPFVECVDDTIKYKDGGEVKILTKDAVRGRVRRLVNNKI